MCPWTNLLDSSAATLHGNHVVLLYETTAVPGSVIQQRCTKGARFPRLVEVEQREEAVIGKRAYVCFWFMCTWIAGGRWGDEPQVCVRNTGSNTYHPGKENVPTPALRRFDIPANHLPPLHVVGLAHDFSTPPAPPFHYLPAPQVGLAL